MFHINSVIAECFWANSIPKRATSKTAYDPRVVGEMYSQAHTQLCAFVYGTFVCQNRQPGAAKPNDGERFAGSFGSIHVR